MHILFILGLVITIASVAHSNSEQCETNHVMDSSSDVSLK